MKKTVKLLWLGLALLGSAAWAVNRTEAPPLAGRGVNPITVFGTTYTASTGTYLSVPENAAQVLEANGWTRVADQAVTVVMAANSVKCNLTGTTANATDCTAAQIKSLLAIGGGDVSGIVLTGTTGSAGGGALLAGACTSGTATVTGATTAMAVSASPVTYPGDGNYWVAYVSASNTVTVKVCSVAGSTPGASAYNVRVLE